jgi:hypothetical protein
MNSQYRMRPDWVMLGVSAEDGVYIFASSDLTEAELEAVADEHEVFSDSIFRRFEPINRRFYLRATMKTFTMVKGATYGEALRNLFNSWTPPEPERKAINEAPRGLPEPLSLDGDRDG